VKSDCIFCKIASGGTATKLVLETQTVAAFHDINPAAPVHILIVPKKHIRSLNDVTEEDSAILSDLLFAAKQVAEKTGINESGYQVFFNVEQGGGQLVFHLHMHVMGGWSKNG